MAFATDLSQYPQLVREFATYKQSIQGCSQKTVNEYLLDLRTFLRYMCAKREGLPLDAETLAGIDGDGVKHQHCQCVAC